MKPDYWDRAKRTLARKDPVMAAIIHSRPKVFLARRGEPFVTLARAIVGQQISVMAELTQVRVIGRWTAEMFLIFSLLRPDVFPLDDLGLQKAIRLAYFKRKVSLTAMAELGRIWHPWRSVATWYLWRSLDPLPVEY